MIRTDRLNKSRINDEVIEGVVIGVLLKIENGSPFVVFPGNATEIAVEALSTQCLSERDLGAQVALSFESGQPARPIILGKIVPNRVLERPELTIDDEEPRVLVADRELTLRCGKASITLTKEGKIILRGTYISSRSSGPNRIKGGSVHLN